MATVAQVCKNDVYKYVGSSHRFPYVFSSFIKVRLSCSIQSNPPLYFDEVVSVSEIFTLETATEGKQRVVFAVMNSLKFVDFSYRLYYLALYNFILKKNIFFSQN